MATAPEAVALTEAHRVEQARISAQAALATIVLWREVHPWESDAQTDRWIAAMLKVIALLRDRSAATSRQYLTVFRQLEGVTDDFAIPVVGGINVEQVTRSLSIVGPHEAKQRIAQAGDIPIAAALDKVGIAAAKAAQRHAINGSRDTISEIILNDPKVRGYQRVTDGDPCYFCAMLASRGPVYQEDSFDHADPRFHGPGDYKVHDGCGCSLEPIYHSGTKPQGRAQEFETLWRTTGATKSGRAAVREFRRHYEGRAA